MSNFHFIAKAAGVEKVFDTNNDKLIVLMMFTKSNVECRRAKDALERIASNTNNNTAVFCVVDVDHLDGTNRYVNNSANMPRFDLYLNGQLLTQRSTSNDREIDELVKYGIQQVMTRSMSGGQNLPGQGIQPMPPQVTQQHLQQIRQTILNNAMQNPMLYQQYMQNPNLLNMHIMQQAQQLQQQLNTQFQMQQQIQQPQVSQLQQMSQMPQMPSNIPGLATLTQSPNTTQVTGFKYNLQELADIFEIFKNMVRLGLINIDAVPSVPPETQPIVQEEIILPNGDKIIKIDDDKYVIERSTN